jgi:two-component system sensor histidine kinase VanS
MATDSATDGEAGTVAGSAAGTAAGGATSGETGSAAGTAAGEKSGRRADYSRIKRKLYSRVLAATVAAVAFVVFLRVFVQRQGVGDWVVGFLEKAFRLDRRYALAMYQGAIRGNAEILVCAAVAVCFFFLCRAALSGFMRYFDEANAGIDSLIRGDGRQIELSPEMAFMEQKLNALRQTLEKREQDAKLAERRKNDLVMYLAHDIKTPLTSVIGYLSLLDEAPDMPAEQRAKYARVTLDKACRLERLIDEFFEITRYNLQTIALAKENIDLSYMLAQLADEFYPQLAANGKRAAIHAPEDLTVYGDPDRLARVFNNVLKNAVAYSPDNSVIDITAAVQGGAAAGNAAVPGGVATTGNAAASGGVAVFGGAAAVLGDAPASGSAFVPCGAVAAGDAPASGGSAAVLGGSAAAGNAATSGGATAASGGTVSVVFTNAGTIPEDKLASIFDKFYRLDSARSSYTGGAGLGLAVAKEIVALHGGHIHASSGGGKTSFTVELPAAKPE